jgi:hypothetical protein
MDDDVREYIDASSGWHFRSLSSGRIASQDDFLRVGETFSDAQGNALPLPEMLYLQNFVEASHAASGLTFRWDALGALHSWMGRQKEQVAASSGGSTSAAAGLDATFFDWTFTTDFNMSVVIVENGRPKPLEKNP